MVATLVVGKQCSIQKLQKKLLTDGFNLTVVMFSTAVAENDSVFKYFMHLARTTKTWQRRPKAGLQGSSNSLVKEIWQLMNDKAVYHVTSRMFLVMHRAKLKGCIYTAWTHNTAVAEASSVEFGTVYLVLDTTRQTMREINVGVLDVIKGTMTKDTVRTLADWIVDDKLAMVTGYFGPQGQGLVDLAQICRATWKTPLYQEVRLGTAVAENQPKTHPSYFLTFAKLGKKVRWPDEPCVIPRYFKLGIDIERDLVPSSHIGSWPQSRECQSEEKPFLGRVMMKPLDFPRMPFYTFWTMVWFGSNIPSLKSQRKFWKKKRGQAQSAKWKGGPGQGGKKYSRSRG